MIAVHWALAPTKKGNSFYSLRFRFFDAEAPSSVNRRQTIRVVAVLAFAHAGILVFDGQVELEALQLFKLPEASSAVF